MKKNIVISALVLASVLAFTGCSKDAQEAVETAVEETAVEATEAVEAEVAEVAEEVKEEAAAEETATESTEAVAENTESTETAATLEAYFAANESDYQDLKSAAEATEGLTIDVAQNTIYYYYTVDVTEETREAFIAGATEAMAGEDAVNNTITAVHMTEVGSGVNGVNFVYVYVDVEGNELVSFTFNSEGLVVEE